MASANVEVIGMDALLAKLDELQARGADQTPVWEAAAGVLIASTEETFDKEGRPVGWIDLKPATWARRNPGRDKILQDDGRLKRSVTTRSWATGVEHGVRLAYAARQHFGFKGTVHVPAHSRSVRKRKVTITKAFGRQLPEPVTFTIPAHTEQVSAHTAEAFTPARPFIVLQPEDVQEIIGTIEDYLLQPFGGGDGPA